MIANTNKDLILLLNILYNGKDKCCDLKHKTAKIKNTTWHIDVLSIEGSEYIKLNSTRYFIG